MGSINADSDRRDPVSKSTNVGNQVPNKEDDLPRITKIILNERSKSDTAEP